MNTSDKAFYGLKRLVFREVMPGDRLKVVARSNKTKSGGGARDLRFSKMEKLLPILEKLFPKVEKRVRLRGGVRGPADVRVTDLHWVDERGSVRSEEVALELPTDGRKKEPRIATVHRYESFSDLPPETEGQAVTILAQDAEGRVWPFTASEASLRGHKSQTESWDPDVANYILEALKEKERKTDAAIGYIDYDSSDRFHN